MSGLLFVVGAVATIAGAAMVGFGIPINTFSFGNTLIAAGATTFIGGLIILSLGVVVAQLQRVVDALAERPALQPGRPEMHEQPLRTATTTRGPFPPAPSFPPTEIHEPPRDMPFPAHSFSPEHADDGSLTSAPQLQNPDEPPPAMPLPNELPQRLPESLSRPRPAMSNPLGVNGSGRTDRLPPAEPAGTEQRVVSAPSSPPRPSHGGFFDTMWPAPESRPAREALAESPYERKNEFRPQGRPDTEFKPEPRASEEPSPFKPTAEPEPPAPETRAVAILKSGVVDGMGYTLYVDGSIEADLPQGKLRFASINELRSHLENR